VTGDQYTTVVPSAGRLMVSLRDIGYEVPSAVADLVDNAIDANAKSIAIDIVADGGESWIRVTDDGFGISRAELDEAMRYGTQAAYAPRALGHFGLGLKTASLSQCRRLTVASRPLHGTRIAVRRWDLDVVLARNSWDLEHPRVADCPSRLVGPLSDGSHGTVVFWEKLDRVIPPRPTDAMTERVLRKVTDDVREHLAMVFHRFLDGEAYNWRERISIRVNDEPLKAWDPFARSEAHTRTLPLQRLEYTEADGREIVTEVQPYVLPGQQFFSSPDAHRTAAGPARWNRHQGFYVFRRDRLIQAGGWNRLRTLDEHAKLARIAVDLPLGEEHRFAVDVAKMRVSIPEDLRAGLRAVASAAVAVAQESYRDHLDANVAATPDPSEKPSAEAISISRDWPAIMSAVDRVLGEDMELRDRLLLELANADPDDATLLGRE
jgi:anti-sigma regulatory factor (Ser/Thr protein kinase)